MSFIASFIDGHDFPAGFVLRVLDVPESTYYDWRARRVSPSRRELDDAALLEQILKVRAAHEFAATYGSPRPPRTPRGQPSCCGPPARRRLRCDREGPQWSNGFHRTAMSTRTEFGNGLVCDRIGEQQMHARTTPHDVVVRIAVADPR
jgi:hypothetical protein